MKKLVLLVIVVLGLLAVSPGVELQSSTQAFGHIGTVEGDGGG
jgi:hypothetical protein